MERSTTEWTSIYLSYSQNNVRYSYDVVLAGIYELLYLIRNIQSQALLITLDNLFKSLTPGDVQWLNERRSLIISKLCTSIRRRTCWYLRVVAPDKKHNKYVRNMIPLQHLLARMCDFWSNFLYCSRLKRTCTFLIFPTYPTGISIYVYTYCYYWYVIKTIYYKNKIHSSSCEIEDFVETHLCKLCVILR